MVRLREQQPTPPDQVAELNGIRFAYLDSAANSARPVVMLIHGSFSMGGGVVLSLSAQAPRRIQSIVMLSAIGVQEHEFTGSFWVNHVLHGAQLAGIWGLREGVPHFGGSTPSC
jgi:hypothetical protein